MAEFVKDVISIKKLVGIGFILSLSIYLASCGHIGQGTKEQEATKEVFEQQETDIVQRGEQVENIELMEQFAKDSQDGKESEIRYVVYEPEAADPTAVYHLRSRTDTSAGQSWVEIYRDFNFDKEGADLIESQQCSSVAKDPERGSYVLTECFHTWEIELMPAG